MATPICASKTKMSLLLGVSTAIILAATFLLSGCSQKPFNQTDMPEKGDTIAVLTTSKGLIKIRLFEDKTPEMVKNFTTLAGEGKYDGVTFHRVIKDFMVQTGDFQNNNGTGGHSYKGPGIDLNDEIDPELKHIRGAVSMANRGPNTNGSQFFIVHPEEGATFLDGGYTIFGQVFEGLEAVDAIAIVETDASDKPLEAVLIEKMEIVEFEE